MTRNLKALGLVLGAVFAFSAMAASSASAVDTFTVSNGSSTAVSGVSHDNVFRITGVEGATVECTTSTFTGTATNGASSLTVTATYTGKINETPHGAKCNALGTSAATVNMNSCDYDLTGSTTGADPTLNTDATVSITCEPNKEITVTTDLGAVLKIPAQTPTSGGVAYDNEAGKVKVTATATGITYTCESAFLCGLGHIPTEGNTADYTGTVVAGSTTAGVNISVSGS